MAQCFAGVIGGQHAQRGAEAEQVGGEPVWVGAADRGDGGVGTVGMVGAEVRRDESHRLIYAAGASSVGEVRIVSVSSSGHQPGAIFTNLQRHIGGADSGAVLPAEQFFDPANAARLWEVSEQLVS